jgi:uncharacterized membrane protein
MEKNRLEAFSDGVFAIIITIMVLELKTPHGNDWAALQPLIPVFMSYVLSYVFVGIYWGNHHHLLQPLRKVDGRILWANMHLLFWLSLIPFATGWMGANNFSTTPVVVYAVLLLCCGFAFNILQNAIARTHQFSPALKVAFKKAERKGIFSLVSYSTAIGTAYLHTTISLVLFVAVAIVWLVPEKNIERALQE